MPKIGRLANLIEHIWDTQTHVSAIFPEDTDEWVTVTAGDAAHKFGDWAELKDNNNVTLSSKFASYPGHIVAIIIEAVSQNDAKYLIELAYGDDETMIARSRFMKQHVLLDLSAQMRVRSIHIPAGETFYYRLKCETADATAYVQIRYFLEA